MSAQRDSPALESGDRRCGRWLLALAAVVLVIATWRNIDQPWEQGLRGVNGASYSHVAVFHTVHHGLGATLGTPAFVAETDDGLLRTINWHHPPGYWLYLALWAWPFGNSPMVLRIAHLTLFLPALLALYAFLRQRANATAAGFSALLFASCPLVAYYGAMVIQDGAVVAAGLMTMACFERHASNPTRQGWMLTALAFFVTCSLDMAGYWWGPAMFVFALGHERRGVAVRSVVSLFPVAVLAFAALACHYGWAMGGIDVYLRELIGAVRQDHGVAGGSGLGQRFSLAMQELWLHHQNEALLGLAALGVVVTPLAGGKLVRRMFVAGVALLVPGLLHYVVMLHHALDHVFWSMQGFAGLCTLAAIVPVAALQPGTAPWRRPLAALLAAATIATIAWGAFHTHTLVERFAFEPTNDTPAMLQKALPHLTGCSTTLTSCRATTQTQFGHTSVFYEIDTPEKLETVLAYAKATKVRGKVGFVVHPTHRENPLVPVLEALGSRREVDGLLVYQLRF